MAEVQLLDQAIKSPGHFNGGEILALDVLDQRNFQQLLVGKLLDDHWNPGQAAKLRGPPPAFACYQLVPAAAPADDQRLDNTVSFDGLRELL